MRLLTPLVSLALLGFCFAGALAVEPTPSADENWQPPGGTITPNAPTLSPSLVPDGSFEQGPPPGSAWTEFSSTPCEWITDPSGVFGVGAFDGTNVYWSGGYCPLGVASIDNVRQTMTFPNDVLNLSFWYLLDRGDPDDDGLDITHLVVGGDTLWTIEMSQANSTGLTYVNHMVDATAYAGQTVEVEFGAVATGLTGNVLIDFIEFVSQPVPAEATSWGRVKQIYR